MKTLRWVLSVFALCTGGLRASDLPAVSEPPARGRHGAARPALADPATRASFVRDLRDRASLEKREALARAGREGWLPEEKIGDRLFAIAAIKNGRLYMRGTHNREAAISLAVDRIRHTPPWGLSGTGVTVGVWDAGLARSTHQEFGSRVTPADNGSTRNHSTHVTGTIAASGVVVRARGMAPEANVLSYDWEYDYTEMAAAGMASPAETNTIPLSNHSYGFQAGWAGTTWYGTWGNRESDGFGIYGGYSELLDTICWAAPYFLPFKSAGNDRNDNPPSPGATFNYYDGGLQSKPYDPDTDPLPDNWDNGGYDTIAYDANAKNVVTVGAVSDAVMMGGRSLGSATMADFSSWGPSDDGRLKPDLVANGMSLYSTYGSGDRAYGTSSGTSMASPNACGAAALLVEYYGRLFPGQVMLASTLKGLLIHTADDLGRDGPDYAMGWGLVNAEAAARHIRRHHLSPHAQRITEDTLGVATQRNVRSFFWNARDPIRLTLCWTDPPGVAREGLDNPATNLVHDLDLRLISPGGQTNFPFVLDPVRPDEPAATGDNDIDNVEQILLASPQVYGTYRIIVGCEGELSEGPQAYSLVLSGTAVPPEIELEQLENTTNAVAPYRVRAWVTSESGVREDGVGLFWNTAGPGRPFFPVECRGVSNNWYEGTIPPQPVGSTVHYYVHAISTEGMRSVAPPGAPGETVSFSVVESLVLVVSGVPRRVPGVLPDYGVHYLPAGVDVVASAVPFTESVNGVRDACVGWSGFGSVPPAGSSNELSFVLGRDSVLAWQWRTAYSLCQTSSIPGVVSTSTWWLAGSMAGTVEAPGSVAVGGTNFALAGWLLDGTRWPDETTACSNPAEGIAMDAVHTAAADYLPADLNRDGDTLPDWWEHFYFGSTGSAAEVDVDGDGFSNGMEFRDNTHPRVPGSSPRPPSIAHRPLDDPQTGPASWPVSAVVTDNSAVREVTLEWKANAGDWLSEVMTTGSAPNEYVGAIPAPGATGDRFEYRILAEDQAGLRSENGPYAFDVRYAVAVVTPGDFGAVELGPRVVTNMGLRVANAGHIGLVWSAALRRAGLSEGSESGTNGWTHSGENDVWHITTERAFSGTHSWYFGNEEQDRYPDSARASLISPPVYITGEAQFSFWHWLDTEELQDETHAWDGCIVEISTDGGQTYSQIPPVGGYPYVIYGHPASAFPDETPCFAGTGGWERVRFDLGDFTGEVVRIRLQFGSDGYVASEGWFVDDLRIVPYGGSTHWVAVSQSQGTVSPGGADDLTVTLDARWAPLGTRWEAALDVQSNDPVMPRIVVPVRLHNLGRAIVVSRAGRGAVHPSGLVTVTRGDYVPFAVQAEQYHHVDAVYTNGDAVAGMHGATVTNLIWPDVSFEGTGTLHAAFAPNLALHGVPEHWLASHGLTNRGFDLEVADDQDGDGMFTWEEYVVETDPTDPYSVFTITSVEPYSTSQQARAVIGYRLEWPSASNVVYSVYAATNLASGYWLVATNLAGDPPMNVHIDPLQPFGTRFYRLGAERPVD
ncbi:S8 family serine peptidase [Verrucomicrobiota bacterium]